MSELFLSVLNMSLTASYVILLVILVRLLLKKAPKVISYALWGVVAFRLIIPFSFESMFSLMPRNTNAVPIPHDIIYQQSPQINSGIEVVDSFVSQSLPAPTVGASVNPLQIYAEIGAYIWALGIIALLVYSLVSILVLKRQLKSAQLIEKNIFEAKNLKTPFVLGLIKPMIYLPVGLNDTERSYILLHEQAHIHRKDHIVKVIAFLILSIHWFNPLVWIAFMLMSTDMELSCDERVLKEMKENIKKPYANSLLSLATGRHILNGSPLAFGEGNVKGRIKNVLYYNKPVFWLTLTAVIITAIVAIGLLANPKGINFGAVEEDSDAPMKHIQIEITQPGSQVLTGRVVTDKDGYNAGDTVSVAISKTVTYDMNTLAAGDWIDVSYKTVREKNPQEFVAIKVNPTGDNYPTTFTLIENDKIIRSNTLRNSRIASEMPALILSGSPEASFEINGLPDTPQYLIIDIGSFGDKIYYTFEKDGRYYVGNDNMHEISGETFDELMQYVYKDEIKKDELISEQPAFEYTDIRQNKDVNYDNQITAFAWEFINVDIANYESNPEVKIIDSKITRLELIETFVKLSVAPIEIYALEYRLLPEDLSKVVLAGGMDVDEEGWLKETCSMGKPLLVVMRNRDTVELVGILWTGEVSGKSGLEPAIESLLKPIALVPSAPELSLEQIVGVDMVQLDYASNDIVIFHDYFGLFVYDLNSHQIVRSLDLKPLNCHQTQGDNYCDVSVSMDGNTVQLHPMSSENMFVYTISANTLKETTHMPMEKPFGSQFVSIEDVVNSTKLGNHSHHAVLFDTGEHGYLHTEDGTIGTLSYVRGDMVFKLFNIKASLFDRRPMIMVNDKIYLDTGKEVSIEISDSDIVGEVISSVDQHEKPIKNGQTNFGSIGSKYANYEGNIVVLINNKWVLFESEQ
jgi:beta-lactamase regulating signal transducer with metallopeptidase domain